MSHRRRPPPLAAAALGLFGLLFGDFGASAASPPSRRSKAFDRHPPVYAGRGILEGAATPGSSVPWPTVGTWPTRPLQIAPELDPLLSATPPALVHAPDAIRPTLAPPSAALDIPLPPRRPPSLGGIASLEPGSKGFAAGGDCLARLRAAGATFAPASQPGENAACGIDSPVRISAIADRNAPGGSISLPDNPVISCRMALRFGDWLRSVSPTLGASRNAALVSITTGPGWECRGRNRQSGGRLSAHANGDALDINTFFFANRARMPVAGHGRDPAFQAARLAACNYFSTVLGPGSAFHDSHLHLDVMVHGRRPAYRLCR
jgi:hypothetical protein